MVLRQCGPRTATTQGQRTSDVVRLRTAVRCRAPRLASGSPGRSEDHYKEMSDTSGAGDARQEPSHDARQEPSSSGTGAQPYPTPPAHPAGPAAGRCLHRPRRVRRDPRRLSADLLRPRVGRDGRPVRGAVHRVGVHHAGRPHTRGLDSLDRRAPPAWIQKGPGTHGRWDPGLSDHVIMARGPGVAPVRWYGPWPTGAGRAQPAPRGWRGHRARTVSS
jgi:hypothetical protein